MTMLVSDKKDLEIILKLQKEAFEEEAIRYDDFSMPPMVQTLDQIKDEFDSGTIFFKYVEEDKIVGSVRGLIQNEVCHVGRLIVSPDYQGKGIAKSLMYELESYFKDKCNSFEIFTGEKSIRPLNLYTKLDYQKYNTVDAGGYSIVYMKKENV